MCAKSSAVVRTCEFVRGLLWRGKPLSCPCLLPKPGRFPPPKINVCESICEPDCVCQGFVRQISPARAALVLLNQASITRPLWIMQGRLLLTYSTRCSRVCLCWVRVHACATRGSFFLRANATGQLFDIPPLGPLNLVSDAGTLTLIRCLWVSAWVCALEASSADREILTQADSSGLHFDTPWLITYSRILSLKKTIKYEVKGASLGRTGTHACTHTAREI